MIKVTSRIIPLAAVCLTLLLFIMLALAWWQVKQTRLPEPLLPAPDSLSAVQIGLPAGEESTTGDVVERPLFWSGRRPFVPSEEEPAPVAAAPAADDELDKVKLLGAYMASGRAGIIFELDGKRQRIVIGEDIGDWTLRYINPTGAIFERGSGGVENTRILSLQHAAPDAAMVSRDRQANEEQDISASSQHQEELSSGSENEG